MVLPVRSQTAFKESGVSFAIPCSIYGVVHLHIVIYLKILEVMGAGLDTGGICQLWGLSSTKLSNMVLVSVS